MEWLDPNEKNRDERNPNLATSMYNLYPTQSFGRKCLFARTIESSRPLIEPHRGTALLRGKKGEGDEMKERGEELSYVRAASGYCPGLYGHIRTLVVFAR